MVRIFHSVGIRVSLFLCFFIVSLLLPPFFVFSAASPNNIISYQGRLLNSNRVPVSSTSASILFELYTASSGGTCVWSNSSATCASATARTVTLTDGLFSENLGDTGAATPYAAISNSIFGDNATLYLQVTINGEVLTPRKYITAAPYALNSQTLDGLDADVDGATASAIVAYNSSGNLVITGNPGGSGVSNGAVYINPASGDISANDVLFGVANGGTSRFTVDAEGDASFAGDVSANDFVCTDCLGFSELSDSLSLDADTNVSFGSRLLSFNLDSTGDFAIRSNGVDFARFESHGVLSILSMNTTETGVVLHSQTSTTGRGVAVIREDNATDYDGSLFYVSQENISATSDATAVEILQYGRGNASAVSITQDRVANATTSPTSQALVINVNEAANTDEVILIRSDADGTPDTEFRFENNGDFFGDGATYNSGADYAEFFPTTDSTLGDYEIACWNPDQENGVERCEKGNTRVVGVISTNPGFVGNNFVGADGNLANNSSYALVGLVGQIDTYVSADAGSIAIGDAISTSSVYAGYGARAQGGSYIIGRALESLPSGTGVIKVLVQPMWYGGDMLSSQGEIMRVSQDFALVGGEATSAQPTVDSSGLSFVGSLWDGVSPSDVSLSLRHDVVSGGPSRLSLVNDDGFDVMTFGSTGDLALAGNFYPSDQGALQYGAYVHYDSAGAGYMKTNAAGWSSRSTGFSEMFPSDDALTPGDVVEFGDDVSVRLSLGEMYSQRIAGVVSAQAGIVTGNGSGSYAVVLSGRTQVKVSAEQGAILPGDPLTTSSRPGYAVKATHDGFILGFALAEWSSGEGTITALIRPQHFSSPSSSAASSSLSFLSRSQDLETLNISEVLSMGGGDIVSVGTLSGIGTWEIQENGDVVTQGRLTQVVQSLQHVPVSTYATTSPETFVQLSGTSTLHGGIARISFEDISPTFNDIISLDFPFRVLVTPDGITGPLYVTDRSNAGFIIRDEQGAEGVAVDWLVLAYRHDFVPEGFVEDSDTEPVSSDVVEASPEETVLPEDDGTDGEGEPVEETAVEEVVQEGDEEGSLQEDVSSEDSAEEGVALDTDEVIVPLEFSSEQTL